MGRVELICCLAGIMSATLEHVYALNVESETKLRNLVAELDQWYSKSCVTTLLPSDISHDALNACITSSHHISSIGEV